MRVYHPLLFLKDTAIIPMIYCEKLFFPFYLCLSPYYSHEKYLTHEELMFKQLPKLPKSYLFKVT